MSATVNLSMPLEGGGTAALRPLLDRLQALLRAAEAHEASAKADRTPTESTPAHMRARAEWNSRVEAAQGAMSTGALSKVVLARAARLEPSEQTQFDPLASALALRARQPRCTTFAIHRTGGQSFVGATPEVLVSVRDRSLETVAMAGTRPHNAAKPTDASLVSALLSSEKDRHEHQLVIHAIQGALESVTSTLNVDPEPTVVRLPDVLHLRTAITGELRNGAGVLDLVERLHPTPAVGGLPRKPALDWLERNEGLDRGWYAGPIGWMSRGGDGTFVVAIRSALVDANTADAYAGCGLVDRSDAATEWEECSSKLQAVQMGLVERPSSPGAAK